MVVPTATVMPRMDSQRRCPEVGFAEIAPSPFGAVFSAAGATLAQYPSRLLTMFFKGSPFSNLPYCFRKKRIA
jgi:hypothetical protein